VQSFVYAGQGLTYWPAHNSLLVGGNSTYQRVAEISIPTPSMAGTLAALPRATLLQAATDILQGKLGTVDGGSSLPVMGGFLIDGSSIVVNVWRFYDNVGQKTSHFRTGQNFAALTPASVVGPYQVGNGIQDYFPADQKRIAGFVSGYMCTIPSAWQAALGGTNLTGQGGKVSVVTRTSYGPSSTVFSVANVGVVPNPVPGKWVMGYPTEHQTLGGWGTGGGLGLYDGTQGFRGMVFPEGFKSILYFGWGGSHFCYGVGTSNPALDGQPVPGTSQHYCYDPVNGATGTHGYPYQSIVYAYNVDDFVAAKLGNTPPWLVVPYATWTLSPLPFQQRFVNGVDVGVYDLIGAAYDPATKRIFVEAALCDGAQSLIHVLEHP
jgi:hypothetical protein